jgi:hypothetical protein
MSRPTRLRVGHVGTVTAVALVSLVGVALGDPGDAVAAAIEATVTWDAAASLAEQVPYLAAGGALIGLGVGVVIASSVTYWYQSKQIGGRLE